MKKSIIASILTASLLAASIAPVYGAEFISDPVETFSAGEETPELEVPAETEVPDVSYEEDDDYWDDVWDEEEAYQNVEMRLSRAPYRTHFAYGLEVKTTEDFVLDGLQVELVRPDGTVADKGTYDGYGDMYADGEEYGFAISIYEGDEDVTYENVHIGEYQIVVREINVGAKLSIPIYVEDPKDILPKLEKTGDGTYSVTTPFDTKGVYVIFTPERDGLYALKATVPEQSNYPWFTVKKLAKEYDDYSDVFPVGGEGVYALEGGQAYCLNYADPEMTGKQMDVVFTAEEQPALVGMEWVEKPVEPLYSGLSMDERWYDETKKDIAGLFNDGKIKLIYADGTEDIKKPWEGTRYGEFLQNTILCGEKEDPEAGTYEAVFQVYGIPEIKLTAEVIVKDPEELPTIKGKGSQTVPFTTPYQQHVRFVTGSEKTYKLTCNRKDEMVHIYVLDKKGGIVGITDDKGIISNLKPNTAYYIVSQGGPMGEELDTITYTVAPTTMDLSKCTFKYSTAVAYTGKALKPTVRIYDGSKLLKKNTDYTIVSCVNNVKIGTATITIKGKGNYTGTVKKTFRILPKKVAISSAKRTGNTSAKLTWGSVKGAYGYVVYRATGNTWTRVGATRSTSFTDKTIKKGTTYKYKVRVYAKVNGRNIYGYDSSVKTVR